MSFADLHAGDVVKFRVPIPGSKAFRIATATVIRYLVFDTHVVVNRGANGTVVDDRNFISQVIK